MSNRLGKSNLYTYAENFGGATKIIDLHLPFSLNFKTNDIAKNTNLPNRSEPLKLRLNKTVMDFMASYPQTESSVYLNAALSNSVKEILYESIAEQINNMSETDAVTYLLNYLHHSFEYKTDRDQFGKEKMFFPDELFYYDFSDCEDRTVLFTKLVNDLVGLDVVALTYFNHMAAAVSFSQGVEGYSLNVDGHTYTICDPTYINAPIGSVMSQYKGYTPLAIKINNDNQMSNIWQEIAHTLEKDNGGKIIIKDRSISENGKYVVSGWFTDEVSIGGHRYRATADTRDLWYATFNAKGGLEWFLPVQCSGFSYAQAFNVGKKGNVYSLVNYYGSIETNNRLVCKSENTAHLILGISNKGSVLLNENFTLEAPEGKKLAFYGKFKPDGTKVDLVSFPTDKVRFDSKITVDSSNDVVFRGIVGEIEGLTEDVPITMSAEAFSAEKQIESYIDDYKQQDFNHKIAGVFATVKLLSQNGGRVSGADVQNLLNKKNPNFKAKNPEIYKSLTKMKFVVNKGGIVKVETLNGKKISMDLMSIKNNSNLQIVKSSDDVYTVNCLNGVQVGKAFIWFDLNSISLKKDGKLVFDYDKDHTIKEMPISEIID